MLDAGLELEPERQAVVHQLANQEPGDWAPASVAKLKENYQASAAGIPLKYSYGSDFPYRETDRYLPSDATNIGLVPSLAKGGFSSVWGAAVLPYLASEFGEWPIRYEDLAPHYRSVLAFTGLAATSDDLETLFPLHSDTAVSLRPSRQAETFLADLANNRERLRARGIRFGKSRLAGFANGRSSPSCKSCGLCMYGCPYGLIYNTSSTLEELTQEPGFTYRGGLIVERFSEIGGGVKITAKSRADGRQISFEGSRLYVAAGVLSSTKMLLDSVEAHDQELTVKDSQYFLLPLLRYRRVAGACEESLHTLAQAFVEILDENLSPNSIHLQVYSYNELYRQAIQGSLGRLYRPLKLASDRFLERLLLIQGYVHSDLSATISLRIKKPQHGAPSKMVLTGNVNPATRHILKKTARKLFGCRSLFKAVPLTPLMKIGQPGRGFHSGGTLPMRARPGQFETDSLGRPSGFKRVHIVDSSVFPTINASTITLTVMANAHRIASLHDAGDAN